jgi:hypothetical protein
MYLFPDYEQLRRAFIEKTKSLENKHAKAYFADTRIVDGDDTHYFVFTPLTFGYEKIMGAMAICDATAVFERLNETRAYLEHRISYMKERVLAREEDKS